MNKLVWIILLVFLKQNTVLGQNNNLDFPILKGPYLGQEQPGLSPKLFAPGIVSGQYFEHSSPVFTPDLKEIYWSTQIEENGKDVAKPILFMKLLDDGWTRPEIPTFAKKFICCENPFITPDGKKLFFSVRNSMRSEKAEIWSVNRAGDRWDEPQKMDETINDRQNGAVYPSVAGDGTMYFMGLLKGSETGYGMYVSRCQNGRYEKPAPMDQFNRFPAEFAPYIAPDQGYILFCSFRNGGHGSGDLYICFKKKDGSWGDILNMGNAVNTDSNERFPNVSPDGRYLFFNSTRRIKGASPDSPGNGKGDVYWIDAKIINELRPKD